MINLDLKLEGKLPVTRNELIELINSWGRTDSFQIHNYQSTLISYSHPNKCYDLSNLDVSKITDLSNIFCYTMYNGDLSKWDVSNCKNLSYAFSNNKTFNNDSICNWNITNITNLSFCFCNSNFNGDISKWDVSNVENFSFIFYNAKFNNDISNWNIEKCNNFNNAFNSGDFDGDISKWKFNENVSSDSIFLYNDNFEKKYNDGKKIPIFSSDMKKWFEENKNKMASLNITKEELIDIDYYLSNFDLNKELTND